MAFAATNNLFRTTISKANLWLCIALVAISAILEWSSFRYIKYLVSFLAIFIVISKQNSLKIHIPEAVYPFLLLISYGILNVYSANFGGIKDLFFIFSGVVVFLCIKKTYINLIHVNYLIFILFFLLTPDLASFSLNSFSLKDSTSFIDYETNISSILGMFALLALYHKNFFLLIFNILLMLVNMKRISLLALLVVLILWFIPKKISCIFLNKYSMVFINLMFLCLLYLFGKGYFDTYLQQILGMSSKWLSMGRTVLYQGVLNEMSTDFFSMIFGFGSGSAYPLTLHSLDFSDGVNYPNLHSDILKIFFEYGFVIFGIFFFFLYRTKHLFQKYLALYLNILFLCDNVLVFSHVLFFYFLIQMFYDLNSGHCNPNHRTIYIEVPG